MTPRFLLAKYVPDLGRMEPRNIGLFLWWRGKIYSRFLPTTEAAEFVNEPETYEAWLAFWAERTSGKEIAPKRGKPVSVSDPSCLDALASTQKGNYLLVDAGELLSPVKKTDIAPVMKQLYCDLVAMFHDEPTLDSTEAFSSQCNAVLQKAGVKYKKRERIAYRSHGVTRHLRPDYYIGNGRPAAVLQKAALVSDQSVNNAAYIMESLASAGVLPKDACGVLVRASDIDRAAPRDKDIATESLALLRTVCRVIDVEAKGAEDSLAGFSTAGH